METILIKLTLLLFFGLVTITIIAIALIITFIGNNYKQIKL